MEISYRSKLYKEIEGSAHRFFPNAEVVPFDDSVEISTDFGEVNVVVTLLQSSSDSNLYAVDDVFLRIDSVSLLPLEALRFISNMTIGFELVERLAIKMRRHLYNPEEEEK
jgi:hypothetical protein